MKILTLKIKFFPKNFIWMREVIHLHSPLKSKGNLERKFYKSKAERSQQEEAREAAEGFCARVQMTQDRAAKGTRGRIIHRTTWLPVDAEGKEEQDEETPRKKGMRRRRLTEHWCILTSRFKTVPRGPRSKEWPFYSPLVLSRPVPEVFFLYTWFSTHLGGNTLSRIQWEMNLYLPVPNSFLSLPASAKTVWNQHHWALWEKEKPSARFTLWKVEGSGPLLGNT